MEEGSTLHGDVDGWQIEGRGKGGAKVCGSPLVCGWFGESCLYRRRLSSGVGAVLLGALMDYCNVTVIREERWTENARHLIREGGAEEDQPQYL